MGWCHEFGPQISEGCDHPMVAGATSCTCQECGAECKGRFAGCVDVWARGPREVAVRATTFKAPEPSVRPAAATTVPSAVTTDVEPGAVDNGLRLLLDELIGRCEAAEAVASKVDSLAQAHAASDTTFDADAEMAGRLEQLSSRLEALEKLPSRLAPLEALPPRLAPLEHLSSRLEALEKLPPAAPVPAPPDLAGLVDRLAALESAPPAEPRVPAALVKQMERLVSQVQAIGGMTKRLASLEAIPGRLETLEQFATALESNIAGPGTNHDLQAITTHLSRLTTEMASLRAVPKRVEAIERVQGRVNAIDKSMTTVTRNVRDLSEKIATRTTPTIDPETAQRIDTLDASNADLVQTMSQLSSQVAELSEVPERVEALEQAPSPSEKVVASMAKRIDRLSTQGASVKELPERLEALERAVSEDRRLDQTTERVKEIAAEVGLLRSALEMLSPRLQALGTLAPRLQALEEATAPSEEPDQSSDRSDVLARGLGHAIDMIDQLAHQVAVLEEGLPVSENAHA